ncbi:hypothetical protein CAC42_2811 [Sphaceloma murrayae]|uniref:Uncharacterized protein n=1 Tax=Sphaceloma murrayae TaxID=2082308 RepID=A0A2K1R0W9_9PEZI|nr:hypothetical protein CAC42_2811 [Sphaceloma murrayae]
MHPLLLSVAVFLLAGSSEAKFGVCSGGTLSSARIQQIASQPVTPGTSGESPSAQSPPTSADPPAGPIKRAVTSAAKKPSAQAQKPATSVPLQPLPAAGSASQQQSAPLPLAQSQGTGRVPASSASTVNDGPPVPPSLPAASTNGKAPAPPNSPATSQSTGETSTGQRPPAQGQSNTNPMQSPGQNTASSQARPSTQDQISSSNGKAGLDPAQSGSTQTDPKANSPKTGDTTTAASSSATNSQNPSTPPKTCPKNVALEAKATCTAKTASDGGESGEGGKKITQISVKDSKTNVEYTLNLEEKPEKRYFAPLSPPGSLLETLAGTGFANSMTAILIGFGAVNLALTGITFNRAGTGAASTAKTTADQAASMARIEQNQQTIIGQNQVLINLELCKMRPDEPKCKPYIDAQMKKNFPRWLGRRATPAAATQGKTGATAPTAPTAGSPAAGGTGSTSGTMGAGKSTDTSGAGTNAAASNSKAAPSCVNWQDPKITALMVGAVLDMAEEGRRSIVLVVQGEAVVMSMK